MNKLKQNEKGFTLIELLVVIAIIGLLASVVLLALGSARQKSRDAKRIADVRQLASALELYYNDYGGYPTTASFYAASGSAGAITPNYIGQLPIFPTPTDGCPAAVASYAYSMGSTSASYELKFCLAAPTGGITPAGTHTLSQTGIQ